MKLIIAILHNRDKHKITDSLLQNGYKFTIIGSTGGFLREGNSTILLGVEDDQLESVFQLIRDNCKIREQYVNAVAPDTIPIGAFFPSPVKVTVGGAVVFTLNIEHFERF